MKQVEIAQILYVEMVSEIASPFGCGVKVQYDMAAVTELDLAPVSAIIELEATRLLNRIYGDSRMLPTERTVVMKCPEVTRAISEEIFGRLATGRWLRTLYRQSVRFAEASASGRSP